MKKISALIIAVVMLLIVYSCGVDGDPGHCYIKINWEYYYDGYGVIDYEDNNPDVPDGPELEADSFYNSYPGTYDYTYISEDSVNDYVTTGFYTLIQNLGTPARLFEDGMDGLDTEFELTLLIHARKEGIAKLPNSVEQHLSGTQVSNIKSLPVNVEDFSWEVSNNGWTMKVTQQILTYLKEQ